VTEPSWAVALENLERQLLALEAALAIGGALELEGIAEATRAALGPLPTELAERAAAVQRRMVASEQAMAAALRRSRQSLALGRSAGDGHGVPRFVDIHH
jgi:hypothetical protein